MLRPRAPGAGAAKVSATSSPFGAGKPAGAGAGLAAAVATKESLLKKRQEELAARREQEEAKRTQHSAAFAVRKVIQRLRVCDTSQYHDMVAELETVQMDNLDTMGDLVEVVREEAQRALEIAEKRFNEMEEKKLAKEQAEEERKRQQEEIIEKVGNIAIEATQEVEEAEAKLKELLEAVQALSSDEDATPESLLESVKVIEESLSEAKDRQQGVVASLKAKREEVAKARGVKEASQITAQIVQLQKRTNDGSRSLDGVPESLKAAKHNAKVLEEKAAKKAAAAKKEEDKREAFKKFDSDGDGKLNKKEVVGFAKAEFSLDLDDVTVDKILSRIPDGKNGVPPERLQQLRSQISQQKAIAKARLQKAEAEEMERVRGEKRDVLQAGLKHADEELAKMQALVNEARTAQMKLQTAGKGDSAAAMQEAADASDVAISAATEGLNACSALLSPLREEENDSIFKEERDGELKKREDKIKVYRSQLSTMSTRTTEVRGNLAKKRCQETEVFRMQLVPCIVSIMNADKQSASDFFKAVFSGKSEVDAASFATFVKSLPERGEESLRPAAVDDAHAEQLFKHFALDKDALDENAFVKGLTELFYKVVKGTVISAEMAINSKSARKLEPGESVLLLEGPTEDAENSLRRVRCRSCQDNLEGWITLAGNKGSNFLEPISMYFSCIKDTNLAEGIAAGSKTVRKIAKGEQAHMLEPERKDDSCGVLRMKVRLVKDNETGWVTVTGTSDSKFFVPL